MPDEFEMNAADLSCGFMVKCSVICPLCHLHCTNCASKVCMCMWGREKERGRESPDRGRDRRRRGKRRETADRRKIVTVFSLPAGNELVKEKSE